jgi:exodeoxyribonuclease V beta subunit
MQDHMAVAALAQWLRRRIAAAEQEGDEERSRRLESDAEAVQVLTIHRSKGLEFPIVYLPYLWHPTWIPDEDVPVTFHDPDDEDVRKVDVGLEGEGFARHQARHRAEQRGEDLRLAYVALTRARHQAVVWWAGTKDACHSPLGRLVFGRGADGTVAESGGRTPSDAGAMERFAELAAQAPGRIGVERSVLGPPAWWSGPPRGEVPLAVSSFDRALDLGWRRTSYSALTAAAHEARVGSEPEEDLRTDEEADGVLGAPGGDDASGLRDVALPLGAMPAGADVGTAVHAVLEATDFAAPDLDLELAHRLLRARADLGDTAVVAAGLRAAVETPLGPVVGGLRLRDVARGDRLDELAFELPLVGGDAPTGSLTLAAFADALRRHLPTGHPLAGYPQRLEDPDLRQELRGFLAGTIDLVVRLPGAVPRFAVLDHKTNRLAAPGEELSAWQYRPAALAAEMQRSHYVLQGLLYTVALHRYLRWRLPGYDPSTHLAGIAYLFLRGMTGLGTPVVEGERCGVFAWRPPGALVVELSDLLDQGERP